MQILPLLLVISSIWKANQKDKKPFSGFCNIIEVKHYLPGRIRFYVPSMKNNPNLLDILDAQLPKIGAISHFELSPISGSILICFNEMNLSPEILFGALVQLLGLESQIREEPKSKIGSELIRFESALNRSVYEKSKGLLDLRTIITSGFLAFGISGLIAGKANRPSPTNMLYWAFNGIRHLGK